MNELDTCPATSSTTPALALQMIGVVHEMEAQLESALGQAGLSLAKFGVISRLVEAGESLSLGCLAERCSCVRSNMTQLIDRLEADRLVERVSDPTDRRTIRAVLTPEGRARYEEGVRLLEEMEQGLFTRLSSPDRATLARLIQALKKNP
jgi:DNA-binding MarR family transcriptional regulator